MSDLEKLNERSDEIEAIQNIMDEERKLLQKEMNISPKHFEAGRIILKYLKKWKQEQKSEKSIPVEE